MTAETLLALVSTRYLTSGDFNGYRLGSAGSSSDELLPVLRELISDQKLSLHFGPHPNPHIKAFSALPPADQLVRLENAADLLSLVAYPESGHLREIVSPDDYAGRPFTLRLALGEGQLVPAFFDLSVLEAYRNDPRYSYWTNETSGRISISDDYYRSPEMREADQVLLETFGYGFDDQFNRVVSSFLIYLSRLSPEHQQIWAARELQGAYKLHPAYFASSIRGEFPERVPIFDAFIAELEQLQSMSAAADLPPLVRSSFSDQKPANFTFLIRPTLKELQDFHATLDKLMSENLNKKFFRSFGLKLETETERADGKILVAPRGTIQLLDDWTKRFITDDRTAIDEMVATFREVRRLRQRPAHAADDNRFDPEFAQEQRQLMIRAYNAIRILRLMLANHPALSDYQDVPDWLDRGEIYDF